MYRRFLGIVSVRPHAECTAGNPDHVARLGILNSSIVRFDVGPQQRHDARS